MLTDFPHQDSLESLTARGGMLSQRMCSLGVIPPATSQMLLRLSLMYNITNKKETVFALYSLLSGVWAEGLEPVATRNITMD